MFENLTASEAREWGRTIEVMKDMPALSKDKANAALDGMRIFGRQVLQTTAATAFAIADRQTNPEARQAALNIAEAIGKRPGRGKLTTNIWEQNMRQKAGANINKIDLAVKRALRGMRGVTRTFKQDDLRDLRRLLTNVEVKDASPQMKRLAADLRQILNEVWYDLDGAGVKVGYASGYLPHIYDADLASADPDKFRDRAAKVYRLLFQREVVNATDEEGQMQDMRSIYKGLIRATDPNAEGECARQCQSSRAVTGMPWRGFSLPTRPSKSSSAE
ncbi:hypothetical protein P7F88_25475 [Vibrio hannami]|uniref:hypothetical protein n=1 Tax=Vibrio hannami TaxID=2717094 RepID=UPI0024100935|nr:hypothetical protein [Vibrio hannami]MDG3089217.1 hypothetical protein [Vibrio hannami]